MSPQRLIKQFVLQNFLFTDDEAVLGDAESLIDRGIVDSTGILELIFYIEETFGVKIGEDEMLPANFESIDAIAAFVERRQAVQV